MKPSVRVWVGCALLLVCWSPVWGQQEPAAYTPPEDIAFRKATIISEGTRMAAELFSLKENENKPLPTIIMCHGWGGVATAVRPGRGRLRPGRLSSSSPSITAAGERATAAWC